MPKICLLVIKIKMTSRFVRYTNQSIFFHDNETLMHAAICRRMHYTAKVRLFSICKQTLSNANLRKCHFSYTSLKVYEVQGNA